MEPVGIEGGEQHDLIAEAGAGGEQRGQGAGGGEFVGAAEGGDDVLAVRGVLAAVLHDLQIGAGPGGLEAEEHGALARAPRPGAIRQCKTNST